MDELSADAIFWDSDFPPPPDIRASLLHELEQHPDRWPDALASAIEAATTYRVLYLEALRKLQAITRMVEGRGQE